MDWVLILSALVVGLLLGLGTALILRFVQGRTARDLAHELLQESEARRQASVDAVIENVKSSFGSLSLEALSKSTEEFLKLAREKLDSQRALNEEGLEAKKGLIDQQLQKMATQMEEVSKLIQVLEKDRVEKFGELSQQLKTASEQTTALAKTTGMLREALASTRVRGQWGERMAEDVLRLAGFIENVNYLKQKRIEGAGTRPDFTFLLPRNLQMNMDVKFPLDNYLRFLECGVEAEKERCRSDFLRDVRAKIREVTGREYINPEQNTVDYVLLFIPNEQIYAFIHEQDHSILEEALRNRVIFCSPITLFAVLAVIRQAVDNFALHQTSNEILSLFGVFRKQWDEFVRRFEVLGRKIEETQKEYEALLTTRRRQVERPLSSIERLRTQRGLPLAPENEKAQPFQEVENLEAHLRDSR